MFNLRCHHPIALTDSIFRPRSGLPYRYWQNADVAGRTEDLHKIPKLCFEGERSWKRGLGYWCKPKIPWRSISGTLPTSGPV